MKVITAAVQSKKTLREALTSQMEPTVEWIRVSFSSGLTLHQIYLRSSLMIGVKVENMIRTGGESQVWN